MRKVLGALRRADERFNLIENGDKIAVGLSGGKDSMLLLYALMLYKKFKKKDYRLHAVTVDLGFNGFQSGIVESYAEKLGVPLDIVHTQIGEIVFDIRQEKNPCALCAKMRKGALYERAKELGCNKAAFAHHADDAVQTLVMSMLYEARLNTFSPKSYLDRQDITLIRPLIMLFEDDVISAVQRNDIPFFKNPCPADLHTKREESKDILDYLGSVAPEAKKRIFTALLNDQTYNLWNKPF
ncbi:MAG: tRNA 2-thiocytidine biosynthesis TtcA family protein [Christensenellaceae bacterium]|jgi:tRNA 2-thiocytidine biosynthesis protein TtcA